jgi:predicted HTH domain antitoxin
MSSIETIEVHLDRGLAQLLQQGNRKLDEMVREYLVLEAYRRRDISSGKAAELLGMTREGFIRYSSRLGISFIDMTAEEWQDEVNNALRQ